jgi:hypothetical protein
MLLNLHSGAGDNQQPGTSRKCMILAQCYVDYMHVNFINCSNIRIKNYFAWLPNPSFLQKYLFWKKKKDGTNDQCLTNHMVLGTFMEE